MKANAKRVSTGAVLLVLARIFHTPSTLAMRISLTPCFSWVWKRRQMKNRCNGLPPTVETVATVPSCSDPLLTQLKQGVNEKGCKLRPCACEICGLTEQVLDICQRKQKLPANQPDAKAILP